MPRARSSGSPIVPLNRSRCAQPAMTRQSCSITASGAVAAAQSAAAGAPAHDTPSLLRGVSLRRPLPGGLIAIPSSPSTEPRGAGSSEASGAEIAAGSAATGAAAKACNLEARSRIGSRGRWRCCVCCCSGYGGGGGGGGGGGSRGWGPRRHPSREWPCRWSNAGSHSPGGGGCGLSITRAEDDAWWRSRRAGRS